MTTMLTGSVHWMPVSAPPATPTAIVPLTAPVTSTSASSSRLSPGC